MSILSYNKLLTLVESGVITTSSGFKLDVNAASIDVRLNNIIMVESPAASVIELDKANPKHLTKVEVRDSGYLVRPGQLILGSTLEILHLPNNIVAHFILKSSVGRLFLNQMQSNHADPGFTGGLTLELQNNNTQHSIRLLPFCKIGQMVFHEVEPVPDHISYSKVGQYNNNHNEPVESKGAK